MSNDTIRDETSHDQTILRALAKCMEEGRSYVLCIEDERGNKLSADNVGGGKAAARMLERFARMARGSVA